MTHDANVHLAVTRTVYEYAYGIDMRDWARYRNAFVDVVDFDFSSYNSTEPRTVSADDWVAGLVPLFTGLDASQHSMSNPLVDADGDTARCRMYMQAAHFLDDWPAPEFTIGGYYDNRLVHTDAGWRLSAVRLEVWWRRGDERLMVEATARGRQRMDTASKEGAS